MDRLNDEGFKIKQYTPIWWKALKSIKKKSNKRQIDLQNIIVGIKFKN